MHTGPYKITNWVQKGYMEFAPDPNYFLGPGLFDKVIIAFRSVESGLAELLRGQPDLAIMVLSIHKTQRHWPQTPAS